MNLSEHADKYHALDHWFLSPQGARVGQAFSDEIMSFNSLLRGQRVLQLGSCGENPWLDALQYQQKWIISPDSCQKGRAVTTMFNQLPFDRDSIDCIIAPFMFEAFSMDKNPMDELDRILKSMGYIIFLGINPWSCWGLALKWGILSLFGNVKVKLTSVFSVKNAALSRGYRQCFLNTFYYIPPVRHQSFIHEMEFLNEMGKMLWLYPAAFYCLVVQKHEIVSPSLRMEIIEDRYLTCVDNSLA